MSDDTIEKGLARLIFLDFLTNDQVYNLGEADFYHFVNFITKQINASEMFFSYFDKIDYKLYIAGSESNADTILEIEFLTDGQSYRVLSPFDEEKVLESIEMQKEMGLAAVSVMNAMTAWETEELPKFFEFEESKATHIQIFLSQTNVKLKEKEKKLIEEILIRMAADQNFYYEHCEQVAFELELRAIYPDGAPKIPEPNSEEDSDDDPFEWI